MKKTRGGVHLAKSELLIERFHVQLRRLAGTLALPTPFH